MNPCAHRWLLILWAFGVLFRVASFGADARRIADLNPGSVGSYPSNFTVYAGQMYFSAYTFETGIELWKFETNAVKLVADINPTSDDIGVGKNEGNGSTPYAFRVLEGQLYFTAFEPTHGGELWRYNTNELVRLSDINPDRAAGTNFLGNSSWPNGLTIFSNALYFSATSSTNPEKYELWRYASNEVSLVADLHANSGTNHSSYPKGLKVFSGALYFMADDGTHGWELWRYSGSEMTLLDISAGGPESSAYPKYFTAYKTNLYFQAYQPETGYELWRTDGTNVQLVADHFPGPDSSYAENFAVFSDALYFRGSDPAFGSELLKFDGSQITVAADINLGADSYPKNLTVFGNALVFAATDGIHGWELWKFDGTNATLLSDINTSGDSYPENFVITAGILYFTATTPETGYELWMYDGQKVSLAADALPGTRDSYPMHLTPMNGKVFFSATDKLGSNWEPWLFDPQFTNRPPTITLTSPTAGAEFTDQQQITFSATAVDEFAAIQVDFYAGDFLIGSNTAAPYTFTTNLTAGTHLISARATDSSGATTASATVEITVVAAPVTPPEISLMSCDGQTTTITVMTTTDREHILEASEDLVIWTEVARQFPLAGTLTLSHQSTALHQFYRVVIP